MTKVKLFSSEVDLPDSIWATERSAYSQVMHRCPEGLLHPNAGSTEYLGTNFDEPPANWLEHECNGRCKLPDFIGSPELSYLWWFTDERESQFAEQFQACYPIIFFHSKNLFVETFGAFGSYEERKDQIAKAASEIAWEFLHLHGSELTFFYRSFNLLWWPTIALCRKYHKDTLINKKNEVLRFYEGRHISESMEDLII